MGTTELKELFPEETIFELPKSRKKFSVREVELGSLDKATPVLNPYEQHLSNAVSEGDGTLVGINEATALYQMINEHPREVADFLSAVTNASVEELNKLKLTDTMVLFGKAMQVNQAFFLRATLKIAKHFKVVAGPKSSPPSSETATATETSLATH